MTQYEADFYGHHIPKMVKELGRIANALEVQNKQQDNKLVTFDDFVASRTLHENITKTFPDSSSVLEERENDVVSGFVYLDSYYIINKPNGEFWSIAGADEFSDNSLIKVEQWLWSTFARDEVNS